MIAISYYIAKFFSRKPKTNLENRLAAKTPTNPISWHIFFSSFAAIIGVLAIAAFALLKYLGSLFSNSSSVWLCGRVFRQHGRAFLPPVRQSDEYRTSFIELSTETSLLALQDPDVLECAPQILRMAREEHASIATFSRLNLELLSLGAPIQLLSTSTRAIAEEIHHSEFMFSFYSFLSGKQTGLLPVLHLSKHGLLS